MSALPPHRTAARPGVAGSRHYHDFLIELIHKDPDITLTELQGALEHAHGDRASVSGIDQALKRLGYTYKKRASLRMSAKVQG